MSMLGAEKYVLKSTAKQFLGSNFSTFWLHQIRRNRSSMVIKKLTRNLLILK